MAAMLDLKSPKSPKSSKHQTSLPWRAGAPLPRVARGGRRKHHPSPSRSLLALWRLSDQNPSACTRPTLRPGWPSGQPERSSLALPLPKTKAFRFHSRKPQRQGDSACLLSWPVWSGQELGKWQLSSPGEKGPRVSRLGPLWGPYPGGAAW